jgi:cytochrome P450
VQVGIELPVIGDRGSVLAVMRNPAHFPQWDGAFMTRDGLVSAAVADHIDPQWRLVPSSSGLIPNSEHGAYAFAQTPLFLDPPAHTRFRQLLNHAWLTAHRWPALGEQLTTAAAQVLRHAAGAGEVELMREVTTRFSAIALATFFGDDPAAWAPIIGEHAEVMWGGLPPAGSEVSLPSLDAFQEHVWRTARERRLSPRDDVISLMSSWADPVHGRLSPAEVQTLVVQSAFANMNVIRLLGLAAWQLGRDPELCGLIGAQPERAEAFVAEVLRLTPPLRGVFRRTHGAREVAGRSLAPGTGLVLNLASASREGEGPGRAGAVDLARTRNRAHLAFGAGIHRCPGARLATVAAVALTRALCQVPSLEVSGGSVQEWSRGLFAGPSELWLTGEFG